MRDFSEQELVRREKRDRLVELGLDPFGQRYDKEDYAKDIAEIKHVFKQSISDGLCTTDVFDNKYIIDFQVASSGIAINKKSFLSFQFLVRQKRDNVMKLTDVKAKTEKMILNIVDSLKNAILEHNFSLTKTKK